MSQAPSTFRVIGLVLVATLIGGLLFAQGDKKDETAPLTSSEATAAVEKAAETPEVTSEAEFDAVATPAELAPKVVPETMAAPAPMAAPTNAAANANLRRVLGSLTIFVLAVFVGFEVITKVPPTLHTPLMSGSNAISGITLVGAVIVAASMSFSGFVGFIAVALATVNAVGGFMVTHRMLAMFKKR